VNNADTKGTGTTQVKKDAKTIRRRGHEQRKYAVPKNNTNYKEFQRGH